VQSKVGGIISVCDGLVDSYQLSSVVGSGGSLAPWVDGVAHACSRDVDCSSYFTRVRCLTFDQAAIRVDLKTSWGYSCVCAGVIDMPAGGEGAVMQGWLPGFSGK
jgi:hypothetical protein